MDKEHRGFLYALIAAFASAAMAIFGKLSAPIPVEMVVFVRFVLGLPILIWVIVHKKVNVSLKQISKHLLRSLAGLVALYCYFYSLKTIPLVNAVTFSNTIPLFMPFVALAWLRVLVSKMRFVAVSIGFVGVLILLRPTGNILEWGSVFGLGAGLFGAIALMGVRLLTKTESTRTILFYYFLISTVGSFFPAIFAWKPIVDVEHWIYLLLVGFFALIYQYMITQAFANAPATKVSTIGYLSIIIGGVSGWLVFGEVPNDWFLLAILLIIGGTLLALFDKTPPRTIN